MSDQALRSKLIRLAHANPELRPHLLPLVTKAAAVSIKDGMKVKAMGVTGKDLKDGQTYTLKKSAPMRGLDTYNFVNSRGKVVARFAEDSVERWLRTGTSGDANGLVAV